MDSILLQAQKQGVEFICPVCKNRFRTNIVGVEPCCTGPNPTLDEHPMEVMVRVT